MRGKDVAPSALIRPGTLLTTVVGCDGGGDGGDGGDGGAGGASKCTSSVGRSATVAQVLVRMPHPLAKYGTKTQP
jgi:hypothetical protein